MRTNKNVRVTLVLLLVAVMSFGTFGAPGAAQETANTGPKMDLRWPGHGKQAGKWASFCWPQPPDGPPLCGDNFGGGYPKAMWVRSGARLKVRIHLADKPKAFSGRTYRSVDSNGAPEGRGRALKIRLKPVVRNGETRAWDAFFTVGGERHHYIGVAGVWPQGDAARRFHVKTIRVTAGASPSTGGCVTPAASSATSASTRQASAPCVGA